ncbi:MAG: alanyl-tRNA editing protein [Candidatus Nanohaloarchaea archaeon]|nr:alanyl-tRNA editing protein [Candidatus Nanohaloarchaea archaeon]
MTDALYMEDCYLRSFTATVKEVGSGFIVLDETAFYPEGGGQPADQGNLSNSDHSTSVTDVQKENGQIRHYVDSTEEFEAGQEVEGSIDWDRRYTLMRMHTAQHLLSAVVLQEFDAETAGNQIHEEYSRMDFSPVSFSDEDLERIENRCNSLIQEEIPVKIYEKPRNELEDEMHVGRSNLDLIPDSIDPLRVVEIEDVDLCPCGGTHVENLKEIGRIEITGRQSKGEDTDRVTFEIRDA